MAEPRTVGIKTANARYWLTALNRPIWEYSFGSLTSIAFKTQAETIATVPEGPRGASIPRPV
jgi:hypothetical protein